MTYVGKNLRTHLSTTGVEHDLRRIIDNLADSTKYISDEIRGKKIAGIQGTKNIYGEEQTKLDVLSDKIIQERLDMEDSFNIKDFASEEQDSIIHMETESGRYSITVDPLDGSSLIDVNLSIGTIVGIHEGPLMSGKTGSESLVAAMYVLYGPKSNLVYTTGAGVHGFELNQVGLWVQEKENIQMRPSLKMYSPGGLRSQWKDDHIEYITELEKQDYKLRYSGALVADVNQILMKGGGIFTYPALKNAKNGKLRLIFELQPLAMIIEEAGGLATNGTENILEMVPTNLDQRSPIYIGSRDEVTTAEDYLAENKIN